MSASISAALIANSGDLDHADIHVHDRVIAVRFADGDASSFTLQNAYETTATEWAAALRRLADRVEHAAASFDGETNIVDRGMTAEVAP